MGKIAILPYWIGFKSNTAHSKVISFTARENENKEQITKSPVRKR